MYRAVNYAQKFTAACKVVVITKETWTPNAKKELFKEIKVHSQLKHPHVLDFMASETYEDDEQTAAKGVIPAVYMLLELAGGGDLFDKIGMLPLLERYSKLILTSRLQCQMLGSRKK